MINIPGWDVDKKNRPADGREDKKEAGRCGQADLRAGDVSAQVSKVVLILVDPETFRALHQN